MALVIFPCIFLKSVSKANEWKLMEFSHRGKPNDVQYDYSWPNVYVCLWQIGNKAQFHWQAKPIRGKEECAIEQKMSILINMLQLLRKYAQVKQ